MSGDEDFDHKAYREYEDQLYQEESLSGSEDNLDSDIEEALYGQVHYASSLLVAENSTPGEQKEPKRTGRTDVDGLNIKGSQKCHMDISVIEIISDDDDDDEDDDDAGDGDSHGCSDSDSSSNTISDSVSSYSLNYPEVVNIFSDVNNPLLARATPEVSSEQSALEQGEIIENWDLNEKDLGGSTVTKRHLRYYTPGKGLPHVRCYNCYEKGHLSQYCPEPKKISVCFLCGGFGHIKRNCPNELCFNCHEPGHISKQCKRPRARPFDRCKRCRVLGHLANDCPDRWRQYHLTIQAGPPVYPDRPTSPPRSVYCYNCGLAGHYGHDCQEENSLMKGELPLPFVVQYDGCHMSYSRGRKNNSKQKPECRPRIERKHQLDSEEFYDQGTREGYDRGQPSQDTHQGYAEDRTIFQAPPNKVRKLNHERNHQLKSEEFYDQGTQEGCDRGQPSQDTHQGYEEDRTCFHAPPNRVRKPIHEQEHKINSEKFYDQGNQDGYDRGQPSQGTDQGYDEDITLFQDPPNKARKLNNGEDSRRVSFDRDGQRRSEFNISYTDRILPKRKKKKKNKRMDEPVEKYERIVEIVGASLPDEGLIEESYQTKRKKAKNRKQRPSEDRFLDDSHYNNNFNSRKTFKQHKGRGFTNSHRANNIRSFEDGDYDARRTSKPKKDRKNFVSNRGFRFSNQLHGKKSNPQFFKAYTF